MCYLWNMAIDWAKYEKDCEFLKSLGFVKTNFAYATGGGEDENDEDLFIKGNIALEWDYSTDRWSKHDINLIDYSNFAYRTGRIINIYNLK